MTRPSYPFDRTFWVDPDSGANQLARTTAFVVMAGHDESTTPMVLGGNPEDWLLPELTARGHVLVVNRASRGRFDYWVEANRLADFIAGRVELFGISRLVIIAKSMSGRTGTFLIDALRERNLGHLIEGDNGLFIAQCAMWDGDDLRHPRVTRLLGYIWRWPNWLTERTIMRFQIAGARKLKWDVPQDDPWVMAHYQSMAHYPLPLRRSEMLAMTDERLRIFPLRDYGNVRLVYLGVLKDPLVRPTAAGKYRVAFGDIEHLLLPGLGHGTMTEQPVAWRRILLAILDGHGFTRHD